MLTQGKATLQTTLILTEVFENWLALVALPVDPADARFVSRPRPLIWPRLTVLRS